MTVLTFAFLAAAILIVLALALLTGLCIGIGQDMSAHDQAQIDADEALRRANNFEVRK
jgi:hypothetical protein